MQYFNKYFGYTTFADDSSHHGEYIDNIIFIGIVRWDTNKKDFIIMTSYTADSAKFNEDCVKDAVKDIKSADYYTCDCGVLSWHIVLDELNLFYVFLCRKDYPQRCAHMCLNELQPIFRETVGKKSLTSKSHGLNGAFRNQLSRMWKKYNNTAAVDALAATSQKVDAVKLGKVLPLTSSSL